jgi:hypothetical protein
MLTTLLTSLLAVIIFGSGGWFLFNLVRYIASGEYDVDKRFWDVTRS